MASATPSQSTDRSDRDASDAAAEVTRNLLTCGVVAGPLFVGVVLIQALTRSGFDLTRHPLSLLSLGDLGWIQISNFVVTGVLSIACAIGMRRALRGGRAATWGRILVGTWGVGLVAAGDFRAEPAACLTPGALPGT